MFFDNNNMLQNDIDVGAFFIVMVAGLLEALPLPKFDMKQQALISIGLWLLLRQLSSDVSTLIVPWWRLTYLVLHEWPTVVGRFVTIPESMLQGGPLGGHLSKIVDNVAAAILWRFQYSKWPTIPILGPGIPKLYLWVSVGVFSLGVNGVLYLWSTTLKSSGNHVGVDEMVESTKGRSLSRIESLQLAIFAFLNAICEELDTRFFWYHEFLICFLGASINHPHQSTMIYYGGSINYTVHIANFCQALLFGISHYHGIPSGYTGVVLTFVYGWILGYLNILCEGGMLLAILTHTIADYFIFVFVARSQVQQQGGKQRKKRKMN